jgi:hypothetical protein
MGHRCRHRRLAGKPFVISVNHNGEARICDPTTNQMVREPSGDMSRRDSLLVIPLRHCTRLWRRGRTTPSCHQRQRCDGANLGPVDKQAGWLPPWSATSKRSPQFVFSAWMAERRLSQQAMARRCGCGTRIRAQFAVVSTDSPIESCTVSPDGRTIVAGCRNGAMHFLAVET